MSSIRRRRKSTMSSNDSEEDGAELRYRRHSRTSSFDRQPDPEPTDADASPWFDTPLAIALLPLIGAWLTGGDHVKDFLLLLIMLFYLYQLIKVPWDLYTMSRPRRPDSSIAGETEESELQKLARSELRLAESIYLSFTVLSPFIGAALLRTVSASLTHRDTISWFSTTLFVLATGIKPWRHLVSRLRERAIDLHNAVHYPPSNDGPTREHMEMLLDRLQNLEEEVKRLRESNVGPKQLSELHGISVAAADRVEASLRKAERKIELARVADDARFSRLERRLEEVGFESRMGRKSYDGRLAWLAKVSEWLEPKPEDKRPPLRRRPRSLSAPASNLETVPEDADDEDGADDSPEIDDGDLYTIGYGSLWYERPVRLFLSPVRVLRNLLYSLVRFFFRL